ncbi:MAG: serine/threonine protein kinase [Acidobacteria bacterium]|nr:serine/threonine protein kinase [Acidobacteriota bacterium]
MSFDATGAASQPDPELIKEYIDIALSLPREERDAFVAGIQPDSVRKEVERLLAAGDFPWSEPAPLQPEGPLLSNGSIINERFEIVRSLGQGGMGEVYEARDSLLDGAAVALKTIRGEFAGRSGWKDRFKREIQNARRASHRNLCRVEEAGEFIHEGSTYLFLTMELLGGPSLAEVIRSGPLDHPTSLRVATGICQGLSALHKAGLVHRDLKSANVMGTSTGQTCEWKITDFGLAQEERSPEGRTTLTGPGQAAGTVHYMAPEQLTGKPASAQTDIFALGVLFYEMLTGEVPWTASHHGASLEEKLKIRPAPVSQKGVNRKWDPILAGCLEPSPGKRTQNVDAILRQLQVLAPARPMAPHWKKFAAAAAVAAALAISAVVLFVFRPDLHRNARRAACRALPGTWVCPLPEKRNMVLTTFQPKGATAELRAEAAGLAQYLRESWARVAPHPETLCVHLGNTNGESRTEGMQLAIEGDVESAPGGFTVHLRAREPDVRTGEDPPLILRTVNVHVPRDRSGRLHTEPLERLADALGITLDPKIWDNWRGAGPQDDSSFLVFLEALGELNGGNYDRAAELFNQSAAATRNFAFAPAQVGLGDAYRMKFNQSRDPRWEIRARQAYQIAATFDRGYGFAGAERRWGELERASRNHDAAREHLGKAIAAWPFDLEARRHL